MRCPEWFSSAVPATHYIPHDFSFIHLPLLPPHLLFSALSPAPALHFPLPLHHIHSSSAVIKDSWLFTKLVCLYLLVQCPSWHLQDGRGSLDSPLPFQHGAPMPLHPHYHHHHHYRKLPSSLGDLSWFRPPSLRAATRWLVYQPPVCFAQCFFTQSQLHPLSTSLGLNSS